MKLLAGYGKTPEPCPIQTSPVSAPSTPMTSNANRMAFIKPPLALFTAVRLAPPDRTGKMTQGTAPVHRRPSTRGDTDMRLLLTALAAELALALPAGAAELALKHVMLSSAGVGYFEYEAAVDGPVTLGLDVKLEQVDDVLKSLVVFDDAGGVGGIELPGRDQSHSAFGDVPFGPEGLASPLAFLNSLQGVDVTVDGPRPMAGRILHAETVHVPVPGGAPGPAQDRTRVSLLTADGLKQFVLEDSDAVQVADPGLRERIARALAASRHESARDARHITIRSTGSGPRTIRVSFVAAAPLWKASYRLVLPPPDADPATAKARLQGWATLENDSNNDWSGVSLSVQYGNPVTFHQAIYRSYFVTRPEVPVEVLGRLLPDVDTRSRSSDGVADTLPMPAPTVAPPPPPAPAAVAGLMKVRPPAGAMAVAAEPVAAQEGAEETVFTIPTPITLAAGHTASVPILDSAVPSSRVSLAVADQAHPLSAIRLANDSKASLPAGVLTLYDAAGDAPYAGDARLGGVPVGESRLIAFAQDLRSGVEWRHEDSVTLASLSAANGVLTVDRRTRHLTHVTLTAPAQDRRQVLVEVAKDAGSTIARDFAQPKEETATAWRFPVSLQAGETRQLTYAVDQHERDAITLVDDDSDAVAAVLNLQGASPAARAALQHIADLRAAEAARSTDRDQLASQRDAVDKDEERLRANLGAVQPGDALRTRLVRQLDADETKHGQFDASVDAAEAAVAKAHQALVDAIAALRI